MEMIEIEKEKEIDDNFIISEKDISIFKELAVKREKQIATDEEVAKKKRKENRREYFKKYREKNKEAIKESSKKAYEKNKEAIKESRKKAYEKNKEAIKESRKKAYEKKKLSCTAKSEDNGSSLTDNISVDQCDIVSDISGDGTSNSGSGEVNGERKNKLREKQRIYNKNYMEKESFKERNRIKYNEYRQRIEQLQQQLLQSQKNKFPEPGIIQRQLSDDSNAEIDTVSTTSIPSLAFTPPPTFTTTPIQKTPALASRPTPSIPVTTTTPPVTCEPSVNQPMVIGVLVVERLTEPEEWYNLKIKRNNS